jgi:hypothetical protein
MWTCHSWASLGHLWASIASQHKLNFTILLSSSCCRSTILTVNITLAFTLAVFTPSHLRQGSWLGALAADLRDYESMAEIIFFFVHHAVIIVVPILYLMWDTFPIYPFDLVGTYVSSPPSVALSVITGAFGCEQELLL